MGMNLDAIIYLQRSGYFTSSRNRILDIGPQTIYFARPEQIAEIVSLYGAPPANQKEIDRLVYFSTVRPGERTTMLSEITDLLPDVDYQAIDVCPGLKNTEILDLNFDVLPQRMRGYFDVVFNFGTTEHIVNQLNCFAVMHDAIKVGGIVYHQLPASGYLDHGYYCYTPLLFRELAEANGYSLERMTLTPAGESLIDKLGLDSQDGDTLLKTPGHLKENNRIPSLNIHVIFRKTVDRPFRLPLEIATAHSAANPAMLARYGNDHSGQAQINNRSDQLAAILASRSWRYTAPLRAASTLARRMLSAGRGWASPSGSNRMF